MVTKYSNAPGSQTRRTWKSACVREALPTQHGDKTRSQLFAYCMDEVTAQRPAYAYAHGVT
ncbi:hypothetical protein [Pantoea stewartii]|uniref:hypothetical protein n=1 Tax=Pantoea stewartii TaxID=66269 RepID=UPI0025A2F58A|nr:hypothetical protein [Pantoea stewartii]